MLRSTRRPLPSCCCMTSEPMPSSLPSPPISAGAAPGGMGGGGEDRVVQHVLPVAGEFLARGDGAAERVAAAAGAGQHRRVAGLRAGAGLHLQRRQVEAAERLDQAEAGLEIVGEGVAGDGAAVMGGEPDRLGLGDQVADGGDQPVRADHHAAAGALRAEGLGGEGVGRHHGLHGDDRAQRLLQVEGVVGGARLEIGGDFPLAGWHASLSAPAGEVCGRALVSCRNTASPTREMNPWRSSGPRLHEVALFQL